MVTACASWVSQSGTVLTSVELIFVIRPLSFSCTSRMLGRLCRKMRLLGYDVTLNPEGETGRFLINADREGRIPVTRSTRRSTHRKKGR